MTDLDHHTSPLIPPPLPGDPRDVARAAAMAEIAQMKTDLERCHEIILQLRADVHHLEDRVTLLTDERNRLRKEVNIYRTACVELATAQANIGLLTSRAADITARVTELLERVDGSEVDDNKAKIDQIAAAMGDELVPPHSVD